MVFGVLFQRHKYGENVRVFEVPVLISMQTNKTYEMCFNVLLKMVWVYGTPILKCHPSQYVVR